MEKTIIQKVCQEIYIKFPQISGCHPIVKKQSSQKGNLESNNTYLFVFSNEKNTDQKIKTYIRVVTDEIGRIIKISTSK